MPYSIGKSFQPGADAQNGNVRGGPGQSPIQTAIKLLSLRLPSVVGARGIAPQALLQSPGGAAVGGDMGVDAVIAMLRRLMQQSGGDGGPQAQGVLGGSPTTSDWLRQETNLGPREERGPIQPSGGFTPRVIPSQSPGEGPSAPAPQPRPAPYPTPDSTAPTAAPETPYATYSRDWGIDTSDWY